MQNAHFRWDPPVVDNVCWKMDHCSHFRGHIGRFDLKQSFFLTFFQISLSISSLLIAFPCNVEEKVSTTTNSQSESAYWSTKFNVPPFLSLPTNSSAKPLWHRQCIQIGKVVTQELLCKTSICPKLNHFVILTQMEVLLKKLSQPFPIAFQTPTP